MVSAEYRSKLQQQENEIPQRAARARSVLGNLSPWLFKYHGGMPVGFLAAIASFESGGKMSSRGDYSLGEVGIFQITESFPPHVGLPASSRYDAETNVFLGCLEYQIEAVRMWLARPSIPLATADNWKLARLAFSIGPNGTKKLLQLSGARNYRDLMRYVDSVGGVALGRQSAGKVWFRVHVIDVLWKIGEQTFPVQIGAPVQLPTPPAGAYTIPNDVAPHIPPAWRGPVLAIGISAAALALSASTKGHP